MFDLWRLLIQFVFRVTWGLALALGVTSSRQVTSGYFQKHLWVLMGLNTLASLAIYSQRTRLSRDGLGSGLLLSLGIGLAVASYVGSVCWLAERARAGRWSLAVISLVALGASYAVVPWSALLAPSGTEGRAASVNASGAASNAEGGVERASDWVVRCLTVSDLVTSGLFLGLILAAMFLGHWYLNTPTMQLAPLRKLVVLLAVSIVLRGIVSAVGVWLRSRYAAELPTEFWIFLSLRWLAGLVGTLAIALLTWQTLKIPNTQSATGLLYAGVVLAFIGELTSQLMSAGQWCPV
ncbi:MAG: hypothetical protein ACKOBW_13740 [Planctomycetota bacterium]